MTPKLTPNRIHREGQTYYQSGGPFGTRKEAELYKKVVKAKYPKVQVRYMNFPHNGKGRHCIYTNDLIPYDINQKLNFIAKKT